MRFLLNKSTSRLLRRSQTGQSIIILALGFVALLAFVGIVTDVSLMFVRYTQLRRAVDAAAIAAAGQMRQDRTLATVGLAARQFIEFHGINPKAVVVETCASSPDMDPSTTNLDLDPELCTEEQRKLVRVTAQIESETVFLRLIGWQDILLEASALSETATLDVVLIMDVSESMLEETSYADWADIGYGMVYRPPIWQNIRDKKKADGDFIDPALDDTIELWDGTDANGHYDGLTYVPQQIVNNRLYFVDDTSLNITAAPADYPNFSTADPDYEVQSAPYSAGQDHPRIECTVRYFPGGLTKELTAEELSLYSTNPAFTPWPINSKGEYLWGGFRPTYNFYGCCNDPTTGGDVDLDGTIDPATIISNEADGRFNDLICQPFKKARDATRLFLQRVDFIRGDRVAFVTFGRAAYILTPYSTDERAAGKSHMIDNFTEAIDALNQHVGVRAEPSFYNWDEANGQWYTGVDTFSNPDPVLSGQPIDYSNVNKLDFESTIQTGAYNSYPAKDNCPYMNADFPWPISYYRGAGGVSPLQRIMTPIKKNFHTGLNTVWNSWSGDLEKTTDSAGFASYEFWGACRDTNIGAALREANSALLDPRYTRSSGSVWVMILLSDGAAGASDPVRRNGVDLVYAEPFSEYLPGIDGKPAYTLTGDITDGYGAYGLCPYGTPSDEGELVKYDDDPEGKPSFPYCSDEVPETRHFCNFRPDQVKDELTWLNDKGYEVKVWGDKKYETFQEKMDEGNPSFPPAGTQPPFLVSDYPAYAAYDLDGDGWVFDEERENAAANHVYDIDIFNNGGDESDNPDGVPVDCDPLYDVDDYARDWADYVGLMGDGESDAQLPTMFTIGFGLNFENGNNGLPPEDPNYDPGDGVANPADYLGEELLRYIADVGDNFQMDTDYQQDYLEDHRSQLDWQLSSGDFGNRGPCEDPDTLPTGGVYASTAAMVDPLPETESCGNYFNAPDQEELERVFDEIASRMFTRLAG